MVQQLQLHVIVQNYSASYCVHNFETSKYIPKVTYNDVLLMRPCSS